MKKYLFLILMFISIGARAQEKNRIYCELVGTEKLLSSKVIVTVDFGQETSFWTRSSKQYLVDKKGKAISFNSMVDAMNYMGRLGWKFEQAYVVTVSNQNVHHWLLSKEVSAGEKSSPGFVTKEQFKDKDANLLGEIEGIKCWILEKTSNGLRISTEKQLNIEQLKRVPKDFSIDIKQTLQFNVLEKPEKSNAYAGISDGYVIIYGTNEFIPLEE